MLSLNRTLKRVSYQRESSLQCRVALLSRQAGEPIFRDVTKHWRVRRAASIRPAYLRMRLGIKFDQRTLREVLKRRLVQRPLVLISHDHQVVVFAYE